MNKRNNCVSKFIADSLFDRKLFKLGLMDMWNHIQSNNLSSQLPYHNNNHMYRVAQLALTLLHEEPAFQGVNDTTKREYEQDIIIACLWHDFGHSGGVKTDAENIEYAVLMMCSYIQHTMIIGRHQMDCIVDLIRCTQFPFDIYPRTFLQRVIRDADLLYTFDNDTGPIVEGLYLELKPKLPEGWTFQRFLEAQTDFHNGVELFTETGKHIHATLKERIIKAQIEYGQSLEV